MPTLMTVFNRPLLNHVLMYWCATGLFILFGLWFWTPTQNFHNEAVNYMLLLPALLYAMTNPRLFLQFAINPILLLLSLLMAYLALTALWGDHPDELGKLMKRNLYTLMFLFGVFSLYRRFGICAIEYGVIFGGAAAAFSYLYGVLVMDDSSYFMGRYSGWFSDGSNPNFTGPAYAALAIILLCYIVSHFKALRLWAILSVGALFVVNVAAMMATFSRSAIFAFIAGAITLSLCTRLKRPLIFAALAAIFSVAIFGYLNITELSARADAGRFSIWRQYYQAGISSPILGQGVLTNFTARWNGEVFPTAHNMILQVFFDGGIVGVVLLCVAFLYGLSKTIPTAQQDIASRYGLILLIFTLISRMFESKGFFSLPSDFWFYGWMGFCFAVIATVPTIRTKTVE